MILIIEIICLLAFSSIRLFQYAIKVQKEQADIQYTINFTKRWQEYDLKQREKIGLSDEYQYKRQRT